MGCREQVRVHTCVPPAGTRFPAGPCLILLLSREDLQAAAAPAGTEVVEKLERRVNCPFHTLL